jgi:murein DD-endopeptidase MepM/ murein hydrolase activator NlpD
MKRYILVLFPVLAIFVGGPDLHAERLSKSHLKGVDIQPTGLVPRYPRTRECSPLTSFYASWTDVDGSKRDEPHSGVDGGRLGEPILAPARGVVAAVWRANWGWGQEGALLIRHAREELGLHDGTKYYYSEFDHLKYEDIRSIVEGAVVERGERLAYVFRPGGERRYLPEVHWEVWEIEDDRLTMWHTNKFGGQYWLNKTGHLIDPLYMLSLNAPVGEDGSVDIPAYDPDQDYGGFRGFTYIFPFPKK